MTGDESTTPSVEILSVTAVGESDDGKMVSINVKLRGAPDMGLGDRRLHRLHAALTSLIMNAVGAHSIGSSADAVHVQVPRDQLEEAVRAIHRAVADFNVEYPALFAGHSAEVDQLGAEKLDEPARLQSDQQVIDRVMNE